jgi:Holliday junction resolvase RusA-like endonuclease
MSRLVLELGEPRTYLLEPVPAPRMTRSAAWSKQPGVVRYKAFRDEVRRRGIELPIPFAVEFYLPMGPAQLASENGILPSYDGCAHMQKPDADNLLKGLIDAVYYKRKGGDSHVHSFVVTKRWSVEGHFIVRPVLGWELQE